MEGRGYVSTLRGELRGGRRGARGQNGEGSSEKEWKRRRVERVQCDSAQHLSLAQKKISYPKKNLGFKIGFEEVWLYNKIINASVNPTSLSPPTRLPFFSFAVSFPLLSSSPHTEPTATSQKKKKKGEERSDFCRPASGCLQTEEEAEAPISLPQKRRVPLFSLPFSSSFHPLFGQTFHRPTRHRLQQGEK